MGAQVGSDSIAAALRAPSLTDDDARAVLLHVDSPGGSAVASETIWREVVPGARCRQAGDRLDGHAPPRRAATTSPARPTSSSRCPATLTGSIGVFGGKVVVSRTARAHRRGHRRGGARRARAHVLVAGAGSTTASASGSPRRSTPIYDDFVAKVAEGRHRSVDEIHAIARGRVWTGPDALANGLVDELGGLRDALKYRARPRAGCRPTRHVRHALHVPLVHARTPAQQRGSTRTDSCYRVAGSRECARPAGRRIGTHAVPTPALIESL